MAKADEPPQILTAVFFLIVMFTILCGCMQNETANSDAAGTPGYGYG